MPELPTDRLGWRRLIGRVAQRTRQPDKAEDLVQAAYLRLAVYRAQSPVENPTAFLIRAAVNLAVDQTRHERVRREAPLTDLEAAVRDSRPLQDEALVARERLAHVQRGMRRLPARTREIFVLHRLDGMRYREIAARLGVSASTVEKEVATAVLFLTEWTEGR